MPTILAGFRPIPFLIRATSSELKVIGFHCITKRRNVRLHASVSLFFHLFHCQKPYVDNFCQCSFDFYDWSISCFISSQKLYVQLSQLLYMETDKIIFGLEFESNDLPIKQISFMPRIHFLFVEWFKFNNHLC